MGLDPHPDLLEDPSARAVRDFCFKLIEATADLACAFKPNSAFFEAFGAPGWAVLGEVVAGIPEDIPVILDAKRGDIASTARQYAQSAFVWLGADALTVNPYLGHDSIAPFIEDPTQGIFLLCKTSNPGSDDIQTAIGDDEPLFIRVARLARQWNEKDNVGVVVGATDPAAIVAVREVAPDLWILAPGIGPQGGDLEAVLAAGLRPDGLGMVVPTSRSISAASSPRKHAAHMRAAINRHRSHRSVSGRKTRDLEHHSQVLSEPNMRLADELLEVGCVKFGDFELKSGTRSPIYFDLRLLSGHPELLSQVAKAYMPILQGLIFDRLAAVPYAGLPIATAIALHSGWPLIYPRKEVKDYGTKASVEGGYASGEIAVLIDDLATSGDSKLEVAERLSASDLSMTDVVVLIDREGGAREGLSAVGLHLHSVFNLSEMIDCWSTSGAIDETLSARLTYYLAQDNNG